MEINKTELEKQKEWAITIVGRQLFNSIFLQINIVIAIIFLVLKFELGNTIIFIFAVIFLLILSYNWYRVLVISMRIQEYLSNSGHNLITAGVCPFIGHLISSIILYKNVNHSNAEEYLYSDKIRYNFRNIESLKFELDEKLDKKEISKNEYRKKIEEINKAILEEHRKKS